MSDKISIAAVMSLPRLGWNDCWGCVHEALAPFGIPVRRFSGVFWGQCMTRAMAEILDEGIDWMLTIDYDSMFTAMHINEMLKTLGDNPHIDALAPLQTKRQEASPLFSIKDVNEITFKTGEPFEVHTAHFGLTLIRCEAIAKTPKPWFDATPDKDLGWGDERIDEDISFWNQFRSAGNRLFITPDVRIGHLEVVCSEYDGNFNYQQMTVGKWKDRERERLRSATSVPPRGESLPDGSNDLPAGRTSKSVDSSRACEAVGACG